MTSLKPGLRLVMGFLKHYPIKKMYNHPAGRVSPPPSTDENAEAQRG